MQKITSKLKRLFYYVKYLISVTIYLFFSTF